MKPFGLRSVFSSLCLMSAFVFIPSGTLLAQNITKVLILSPRVGPKITAEAREHFGLFPQFDNFVEATALESDDGRFYVMVTLEPSKGMFHDTLVEYGYRTLSMIAEKINHYEDLAAGKYHMGDEPTHIATIDRTPLVFPPSSTQDSILSSAQDTFPFAAHSSDLEKTLHHTWGIGFGVSTYSPDLSSVSDAFSQVRQDYANAGMDIGSGEGSYSLAPLYWFTIHVCVSNSVKLFFEAASTAFSSNKMMVASAGARYYFHKLLKNSSLSPYAGVGIGNYYYRISRNYGAWVSSDETLDKLTSQGSQAGFSFAVGTEIPGKSVSLDLSMAYVVVPSIEVNTRDYGGPVPSSGTPTASWYSGNVHLSSFVLSAKILFYF